MLYRALVQRFRGITLGMILGCVGGVSYAQPTQASSQKDATSSPVAIPSVPRASALVTLPHLAPSSSLPVQESVGSRSDQKPVDWFTRVAALAGLLLGLFNLIFGIWKIKRDRRLSVEDDFWFRKIITPVTIEPMLKAFVGFFEDLPIRSTAVEDQKKYALKVTTEFAKLYSAVQTLALFEEKLPKLITDKLSQCEDLLTGYSAMLTQEDASQDLTPEHLRQKLWAQLNGTLRVIKDHHLAR